MNRSTQSDQAQNPEHRNELVTHNLWIVITGLPITLFLIVQLAVLFTPIPAIPDEIKGLDRVLLQEFHSNPAIGIADRYGVYDDMVVPTIDEESFERWKHRYRSNPNYWLARYYLLYPEPLSTFSIDSMAEWRGHGRFALLEEPYSDGIYSAQTLSLIASNAWPNDEEFIDLIREELIKTDPENGFNYLLKYCSNQWAERDTNTLIEAITKDDSYAYTDYPLSMVNQILLQDNAPQLDYDLANLLLLSNKSARSYTYKDYSFTSLHTFGSNLSMQTRGANSLFEYSDDTIDLAEFTDAAFRFCCDLGSSFDCGVENGGLGVDEYLYFHDRITDIEGQFTQNQKPPLTNEQTNELYKLTIELAKIRSMISSRKHSFTQQAPPLADSENMLSGGRSMYLANSIYMADQWRNLQSANDEIRQQFRNLKRFSFITLTWDDE